MENSYTWDERFSVGHPVIDEQHRHFLNLCDKVARCPETDSHEGRATYHTLLNDLSLHAASHFLTEENILAAHAYPGYARHVKEHSHYLEKLTELLVAATMGELDKEGLHGFVVSWWINHILESDLRYAEAIGG